MRGRTIFLCSRIRSKHSTHAQTRIGFHRPFLIYIFLTGHSFYATEVSKIKNRHSLPLQLLVRSIKRLQSLFIINPCASVIVLVKCAVMKFFQFCLVLLFRLVFHVQIFMKLPIVVFSLRCENNCMFL